MNKIGKTLAVAAVAGLGLMTATSCGDQFLNELQRTSISTDFLDTPEGVYSMSESLYLQFRQMYYAEGYWAFTNAGTDEFMIGGDGASETYNTYDARLAASVTGSANTASSAYLWNMFYNWLNRANKVIDKADVLEGSSLRDEALGTAYFLRGFDYVFLAMQHGDIPLVLHASTAPTKEYGRDPREDVYEQAISDLENAYKLLPDSPTRPGKLEKTVAAHYLAVAHLWRASEANDDWNSSYKTKDLEDVIKYADIVLAKHPIAARFEDLHQNFWGYETSTTESSSEIVLRAQWTLDKTDRGNTYPGNMSLCWFVCPYQTAFPTFTQRDIAGGRSYQRMKNTPKYTYFLYDLENDSRFWKSFKTTWAINTLDFKNAATTKYTLGDGTEVTAPEYYTGGADAQMSTYMAGMYVINRPEYNQNFKTSDIEIDYAPKAPKFKIKDYATGKYIPFVKVLYSYDANGKAEGTSLGPNKDGQYAMLSKYLDGAVDIYNAGQGLRDQIIARSSEDLFFKAEALIRQGKINEGLAVLKPLRDRAQFRAGEERDAYMDGGQAYAKSPYKETVKIGGILTGRSVFYPRSSYFYSVGGWDQPQMVRDAINAKASVLPVVTKDSYPKEDEYIMNTLATLNSKYKTDDYTRAMCYLLNEKSREMYGEYKRWNDLARTRTLEDRIYFNDQAWTQNPTDILGQTHDINGAVYTSPNGGNFKKEKHYLRPIPQDFLEKITKDGHALTKEEIDAMQNPGY